MAISAIARVRVSHHGALSGRPEVEQGSATDDEPTMYPWGQWLTEAGAFSHPDQFDASGMSPVAHAIDQSIWSLRCAYAARDLLEMYSLATLEAHS